MTDLAGARVLVTGGAGVVGSTLVDALTPLGLAEIVVYDDFSRGLHENLAAAEGVAPLSVVTADVRDRDALATRDGRHRRRVPRSGHPPPALRPRSATRGRR